MMPHRVYDPACEASWSPMSVYRKLVRAVGLAGGRNREVAGAGPVRGRQTCGRRGRQTEMRRNLRGLAGSPGYQRF